MSCGLLLGNSVAYLEIHSGECSGRSGRKEKGVIFRRLRNLRPDATDIKCTFIYNKFRH